MIDGFADRAGMEPRPDQLRKENIGQANETVAGEQLTLNFDTGLPQLVDPSRDR